MSIRHVAWLILIAALTACGTSAPTHYYLLDAALASGDNGGPGTQRIGIGPVQIPAYLNRPGIVTRAGGGRVDIDEFNLWAEPLDSAVPRLIALGIHNHRPQLQPVVAPWPRELAPRLRFRIAIQRFDAEPGRAVLKAGWSLQRTDSDKVVVDGSFEQSEPIGGATIGDRVDAESRLLDAFANRLATVASQHLGSGAIPTR